METSYYQKVTEERYYDRFESTLVNQKCLSIVRRENDWLIEFSEDAFIELYVPWRIVSGGRIVFSDEDDGQLFGLSEPKNGEEIAKSFLRSKKISTVTTDRETGDLSLLFSGGSRLDAFSNSAGYEAWRAQYKFEQSTHNFVALGGGEIAFLSS
ncbi:hypothetical protein [Roseovarius aestuarii]|uniref:Uncharacterized protein n=1 Tax=Roseovarius aestuarii TaxID=475083 RepID=A0A1X7BXB2_9RHOB|nr:hypothetical protein [Roseovarius aestuarii]SMC14242.1 hypothetical protein ROA7745_04107 [Roseovarius aestuarii]